MRTLNDWIDHVNENENNMTAEVVGEHISVRTFGCHVVIISVLHDIDVSEELAEVIEWDIDLIELEICSGLPTPTIISGVDPYGLIAYIKAAY